MEPWRYSWTCRAIKGVSLHGRRLRSAASLAAPKPQPRSRLPSTYPTGVGGSPAAPTRVKDVADEEVPEKDPLYRSGESHDAGSLAAGRFSACSRNHHPTSIRSGRIQVDEFLETAPEVQQLVVSRLQFAIGIGSMVTGAVAAGLRGPRLCG